MKMPCGILNKKSSFGKSQFLMIAAVLCVAGSVHAETRTMKRDIHVLLAGCETMPNRNSESKAKCYQAGAYLIHRREPLSKLINETCSMVDQSFSTKGYSECMEQIVQAVPEARIVAANNACGNPLNKDKCLAEKVREIPHDRSKKPSPATFIATLDPQDVTKRIETVKLTLDRPIAEDEVDAEIGIRILRSACNSGDIHNVDKEIRSCYREGFKALTDGKTIEETLLKGCGADKMKFGFRKKCLMNGLFEANKHFPELKEVNRCESRWMAGFRDGLSRMAHGPICVEEDLLNRVATKKAHQAIHALRPASRKSDRMISISGQRVKLDDQRQVYEFVRQMGESGDVRVQIAQ
jgi:hypothetical protein